MRPLKQDTIPKSIIRGSGFVNMDLGFLNGKGKLLLINPKCAIVGIGDIPYILYATPEFSIPSLSSSLRKDIYKVKRVIIQSTFAVDPNLQKGYCSIPTWVSDFKEATYISLQHVALTELQPIINLPVEHLILRDIKVDEEEKVKEAFHHFKHLKEVSFDNSLSENLKCYLKSQKIQLTDLAD